MADKEPAAWPGPTSPPPDDDKDKEAQAWPGPTAPDPGPGGDSTQAWPGPTAPDPDEDEA